MRLRYELWPPQPRGADFQAAVQSRLLPLLPPLQHTNRRQQYRRKTRSGCSKPQLLQDGDETLGSNKVKFGFAPVHAFPSANDVLPKNCRTRSESAVLQVRDARASRAVAAALASGLINRVNNNGKCFLPPTSLPPSVILPFSILISFALLPTCIPSLLLHFYYSFLAPHPTPGTEVQPFHLSTLDSPCSDIRSILYIHQHLTTHQHLNHYSVSSDPQRTQDGARGQAASLECGRETLAGGSREDQVLEEMGALHR